MSCVHFYPRRSQGSTCSGLPFIAPVAHPGISLGIPSVVVAVTAMPASQVTTSGPLPVPSTHEARSSASLSQGAGSQATGTTVPIESNQWL